MREALITFRNVHTSEHDEYRLYDMAPRTDFYYLRAQEKDLYHHALAHNSPALYLTY